MGLSNSAAATLPTQVAFSSVVPLNSTIVLTPQTVSSAIAFTVGATALFGTCYVRLLADGTNAPTFTGFTEHGSSAGYNNTPGLLNYVQFWYDGVSAFFAVSQSANPTALISISGTPLGGVVGTSYTFTPSTSGGSGTKTFSITGTLPAGLSFSTSTGAITGTPTTAGTSSGITITVTDASGTASLSGLSIVITAAVTQAPVRIDTRSNLTETVNGSSWNYAPTSAPGSNYSAPLATGYSTAKLASAADGYFGATISTPVNFGPLVAFSTSATPGQYTATTLAIYVDTSLSPNFTVLKNGSAATGVTALAAATGDQMRVRRAGSTMYAEVSKDSGASWTTLYTTTGMSTAALTLYVQTSATTGTIVAPFGSSNIA